MFRKYRGWIGAVTAIILLVSFAVFADTVSMGLRGAEDISWATGNTGSAETFTQTRQIGTVTRTFTLTKPDATYLKFRKALSGGPYSVEDAIGRFWASDGSPLVFSVDQVGNIFYGSVDISSSASLSATVTAIGSNKGALYLVVGTQTGTGITFPTTLTLIADNGSILSGTPAINGPFIGDFSQHFTGVPTFGARSVKEFHGEWWGVTGDDATDNATALNNAMLSVKNSGKYGWICLGNGTFRFNAATINRYNLVGLKGSGPSTILKPTGAVDLFTSYEDIYSGTTDFNMREYDSDYTVDMSANANNIKWFYSAHEFIRLRFKDITVWHNPATTQIGFHHVTNSGTPARAYDIKFDGVDMRDCNASTGAYYFQWTGGTSSDNSLHFTQCHWRGTMRRYGTFHAVKDFKVDLCKGWTTIASPVLKNGTGGSGVAFMFGDAGVSEPLRAISLDHMWMEGFDDTLHIPIVLWSHTSLRGILKMYGTTPRDFSLANMLVPNYNQQFTATYVNATTVTVSGDQTSKFLKDYKVMFLGADGQIYWSTCASDSTFGGVNTTIVVSAGVVPADVTKIVRTHDYNPATYNNNPNTIIDAYNGFWSYSFNASQDVIAARNVEAGQSSKVTRLNGQEVSIKAATELTTIAAAATTDTTITIPANAMVLGVAVRVTTVIPTAATFTVTGATSGTTFNTGASVSTAAGTTNKGTANCPYNSAAQVIRITPNLVPADNTGRVRVTIFFIDITVPTS